MKSGKIFEMVKKRYKEVLNDDMQPIGITVPYDTDRGYPLAPKEIDLVFYVRKKIFAKITFLKVL
jgi:hypothetical protein